MLTSNVKVDINILKLQYLAELVDINSQQCKLDDVTIRIRYPQILALGYPDNKFTICFSPIYKNVLYVFIYNITYE